MKLGMWTVFAAAIAALLFLTAPHPALAATFTVNSTADANDLVLDSVCDASAGPAVTCTLRAAIQEANFTPGFDTINFGDGSGQFTINIGATPLPTIADGVLIDGTTQLGYNPASPTPMVELRLTSVVGSAAGLNVIGGADGTTIKGLAITDGGGDGIALVGGGGYVIMGNYIGLGLNGATALGNSASGVFVDGDVTNTTIGGDTAAERNVISSNAQDGIELAGSSGHTITGNYIGTDVTGTLDRGNTAEGIDLGTGNNNVVGGAGPLGNVISGNNSNGIALSGGGNVVKGNHIGLSVCCPTIGVPNGLDGVHITGGTNNVIGGSTNPILEGNIISGNGNDGIEITGGSGTIVKGNQIGVFGGISDLGNAANGVVVSGAAVNTTIGGLATNARNIISGNGNDGIALSAGTGTVIKGNFIGLGSSGSIVTNGQHGINIGSGSASVTVGGSAVGEGNVISGNSDNGVEISGSDNFVEGNIIGLDPTGEADRGNTLSGVSISGDDNIIGGTTAVQRNVISGNDLYGIEITSTGTGNLIEANYVGTDDDGTSDLGNLNDGIRIEGGDSNTVGGITTSRRNVISGNNSDGIQLNADANSNRITNNYIGTSADGMTDRGNSLIGVNIISSDNTILGIGGQGNVLSGNNQDGVEITSASLDNDVLSNIIGLAADGVSPLGNGTNGIQIAGTSNNNNIGSDVLVHVNRIAFNTGDGITVSSGTGNLIARNSIHDNGALGIDLANDNIVTPNDLGNPPDTDTGANNLQNFPLVLGAFRSGVNFGIVAQLQSTPLTAFTFRFFYNTSCDASGNGEGETFIGSAGGVTGGPPPGIVVLTPAFPVYVPVGAFITATVTDPANNTSEFSNCGVPAPGYIVNSTADPGDGTCDGTCTLRDAILNANSVIGPDTINFNIAPSGAQTIQPTTALPTITDPVTIDGTTQPGFVSAPIIELSGINAGNNVDGLTITAGGSTVRGLVINRFGGTATGGADGIVLQTSGGNLIEGNYIGTNAAGTAAAGNRGNGISITTPNNTIGGTTAGARNLLSGNVAVNDNGGIEIVGAAATGNVVLGNFIGTNAAGTGKVANGEHGVHINGASGNTIGGFQMGAGNVISGNFRPGIILDSANNNQIRVNYIGTDVTGTLDLGNNEKGVLVQSGSSDNTFQHNTIAFNPGPGLHMTGGTGNQMIDNRMYSNFGLGIDLGVQGVTANDAGDADSGPNNLQNFPVLLLAWDSGINTTQVYGTLSSTPNTTFTVEMFYNASCHSSGHGEGADRIAFAQVTTNSSGIGTIAELIVGPDLFAGPFLTATARDPNGSTSEFSSCIEVLADNDGDGDADAADNCPAWPNPAQNLPPWPVPASDLDCDGFTSAAETALGTDPIDQCPDNVNDDAWPPDINESGAVSVTDVLFLKPNFGQTVPPAPARYDLVTSNTINVTDVVEFKKFFGLSCT